MEIVKILALVLIVASLIKMFFIAVSPKSWLSFAKKIWSTKKLTPLIAFILAIVVLYYLTFSGISIVEILASALFVSLLFVVGLAGEVDFLIKKYEAKIKSGKIWKEYWAYILIWLVLILWGLKEIFF